MLPSILPFTLPDGTAFELRLVPGGRFEMGSNDEEAFNSEKPVHPVELDSFYIGKFPVTQALWKAVMGSEEHPSYFQGNQRPKTNVSWEDIDQLFLPKINEFVIPEGNLLRLPTEAEWEFAARGGLDSRGFKFAGSNKLKEVGWYGDKSHDETKPVGLKFPNELGLYDMSGNVWEWCNDWWSSDYYEECLKKGLVKNPPGPMSGGLRVYRGGSYFYYPRNCRSSFRDFSSPGFRYYDLGFRLAFSPQFSP
jgi:formylglycine-generating enzyme required for sulfatase activity